MSYITITEQTLNRLEIDLSNDDYIQHIILLISLMYFVFTSIKSSSVMGVIMGVLLVLNEGFFLLLNPYVITCIFDKSHKKMYLKSHTSLDTKIFEGSISKISKIQIEAGIFSYRICLQPVSKTSVALRKSYNLRSFREAQKAAIAIAQFLNLNTKHLLSPIGFLTFGSKKIELFPKKETKEEREIVEMKQAIDRNSNDLKLYLELARMLDLQGLREEAVVILEQGRDFVATNAHFQEREQIEARIREWSRF